MSWKWLFFSFKGRINREKCWLGGLLVNFGGIALAMVILTFARSLGSNALSLGFDVSDLVRIVDPAALRSAIESLNQPEALSATILVHAIFRALVTPVVAWCLTAIIIKRLHDRNRSGWWMIPFVVVPGVFQHFSDRMGDSTAIDVLAFGMSCLACWGVIELLFLRGTKQTNRFGPDPLAIADEDPQVPSRTGL